MKTLRILLYIFNALENTATDETETVLEWVITSGLFIFLKDILNLHMLFVPICNNIILNWTQDHGFLIPREYFF